MEAQQTTGGGGDPVTAIAKAAEQLFSLIETALTPGILATQSVFNRLQQSLPKYRNPFDTGPNPQLTENRTIIYILAGIVAIMLIAILLKKQTQKNA